MKIGYLYHNGQNLPLEQAVATAKLLFKNAQHTDGHAPAECRLNPAELPEGIEAIAGLSVLSDERVKPNHVRIITKEVFDAV